MGERARTEAVLIQPEKGDPHGLTAQNERLNARPPTALRCDVCHGWSGEGEWRSYSQCRRCGVMVFVLPETVALVLGWKAEPIVDGCIRADVASGHGYGNWASWTVQVMPHGKNEHNHPDIGTVLLLDGNGMEQ